MAAVTRPHLGFLASRVAMEPAAMGLEELIAAMRADPRRLDTPENVQLVIDKMGDRCPPESRITILYAGATRELKRVTESTTITPWDHDRRLAAVAERYRAILAMPYDGALKPEELNTINEVLAGQTSMRQRRMLLNLLQHWLEGGVTHRAEDSAAMPALRVFWEQQAKKRAEYMLKKRKEATFLMDRWAALPDSVDTLTRVFDVLSPGNVWVAFNCKESKAAIKRQFKVIKTCLAAPDRKTAIIFYEMAKTGSVIANPVYGPGF